MKASICSRSCATDDDLQYRLNDAFFSYERPRIRERSGGATVIEDGVERQIGQHDIHGVLYHLREACLATQRIRARQSKQAMRAIKQLGAALRRANQSKGGLPEDIRLVLGLDRMIHHLAAYGKAHRKPKPDAIRKRLAGGCLHAKPLAQI